MKGTRRTIRAARRLFRACVIDGRLDESRVRQVARRVAASRRRGSIAVLSSLQRLVRLESDRHRAVVATATSLPDDLRDQVRAGLARLYGSGLATSFETSAVSARRRGGSPPRGAAAPSPCSRASAAW